MVPVSQMKNFENLWTRMAYTTFFTYCPAFNGLAERAVWRTKKDEGTISEKIACFLFSYGNIPHSTTGVTSWSDVWLTVAFMIGLLNPSLESCLEHNQQKVMISMLMNSSLVFLCLILVKKRGYLASFLKWQDLSYMIELINSWIVRRHQDHIRMHHNTLLTPLLVPEQV